MKKLLSLFLILILLANPKPAITESLTVQTRLLNGRSAPRKTASIEARFDFGDILEETENWSKNYQWVEVKGGETGTVWVHIQYVSERPHYIMKNENNGKIKVRKWPVIGKVAGYIHHGQSVEIEQTILGWGKTKYGWVDLAYLVEEVE